MPKNEKWEFVKILTLTDKENLYINVVVEKYNEISLKYLYSKFKGSKSKMAAKFGKKNDFWYKINWCVTLISNLNLPKQGVFYSKIYLHNKLRC